MLAYRRLAPAGMAALAPTPPGALGHGREQVAAEDRSMAHHTDDLDDAPLFRYRVREIAEAKGINLTKLALSWLRAASAHVFTLINSRMSDVGSTATPARIPSPPTTRRGLPVPRCSHGRSTSAVISRRI